MQYTRIRSLVERLRGPRAIALLAMCAVLIATSGAFAIVQLRSHRGEAAGLQALTLPGQQRWMQAGTPVSSYLFGTTDLGQEGVSPNIETSPAAQQLLKSAGVTVIRTDFPDNASDAVINLRLQTIANAGAACLGTITNPANVAFDVHLVKLATQRGCSMFEVGLSPDAAGVPVATYLAQWKALVPQLRAATSPLTLTLIGPATQAENHAYIDAFLQGAKAANTLPDALSYHWFPCAQLAQDACLAQAPNVTQTVQDAQALMQQDLGTALPIAITAWNAQLSGTPSAYVSDPAFIAPFTAAALTAMGQDGVALAAQVAAASGAGGGALDMIGVHPVQPRAQLIAMMAMVQADRLPCGTPVPTMSPTTGTGTPGVTATAGTLTPGTTATPTAGTTPTATGTLTPTTTAATTPSATVGVTPTMTVTPCPPCPTPQLPMTPTSTSTMPASPTVPVIGTATPTQAAPSATASIDPDTGYRHAHSIAMPTHAVSFAASHAYRNRRADNHPDGNDGDTFSDRHSIVYCHHPYSWRDTLPNWKWYGRVVGQRLRRPRLRAGKPRHSRAHSDDGTGSMEQRPGLAARDHRDPPLAKPNPGERATDRCR